MDHPACPWPSHAPGVALPLAATPEHACPYFADRRAIIRAAECEQLDPEAYHALMSAGFRRSGRYLYQPICRGCRDCMPIRVPAAEFRPDKSQRRCWRRNEDLVVTIGPPITTHEKYDLYRRYVMLRHDGQMGADYESFESFLYESPVYTIECCYREPGGRLVAVGICDLSRQSLSTVYFTWEPEEADRGLGTYGALYEIELARRLEVPWYYMGFWVPGCATMDYKAMFRPHEFLRPDGVWWRSDTPVRHRPKAD